MLSLRLGQRRKGKRKGPYHHWRAFEIRVLLAHDTSRPALAVVVVVVEAICGRFMVLTVACGRQVWQAGMSPACESRRSFPRSCVGTIRLRGLWKIVPHAPRGECRQGRSAFRFWRVTQSVTGCIPTQSVGTIGSRGGCGDRSSRSAWECRQGRSAFRFWRGRRASRDAFPRRAWERSGRGGLWRSFLTLRVGMPPGTLRVPLLEGDAERHGMHAHAERGNDQIAGAVEIVPHAPRGNAARDAPRSASGG